MLTWLSNNWIAQLEKDLHTRYLVGYKFPINNAAADAISTDKVATYTVLATTAVAKIGIRFAAVDIVDVSGDLKVLEINSSFSLDRFSAFGDEQRKLTEATYAAALRKSFNS